MFIPLVSIIIPAYNAEKYISECLDSVIEQSFKNVEIIVVNDGSKDNTLSIVKQYAAKHRNLVVLDQENKGQSIAINEGIRLSGGKYIKIFDADDIMNPEHIEAQLSRMEHREDIVVSSAWGRFYDDNPSSTIFKRESVWTDMKPLDWMKASLSQRYDHMPGWLWLIPQKVIKETGGYNTDLSLNNDFEFSMRLLKHVSEVRFATQAKTYYRSSLQNSLSASRSKVQYMAALKSTDMGCAYLLELEDSSDTKRMCANRYQEWAFRIYPEFPELVMYCENKVRNFGGSDKKMDGGKTFKLLQFLLGWKNAKTLKSFFYKILKT